MTREQPRSIAASKAQRGAVLTDVQRLVAGAELFDEGMRLLVAAIRAENPHFTTEQVDRELERRKRLVRQIDDNEIYRPAGIAELD